MQVPGGNKASRRRPPEIPAYTRQGLGWQPKAASPYPGQLPQMDLSGPAQELGNALTNLFGSLNRKEDASYEISSRFKWEEAFMKYTDEWAKKGNPVDENYTAEGTKYIWNNMLKDIMNPENGYNEKFTKSNTKMAATYNNMVANYMTQLEVTHRKAQETANQQRVMQAVDNSADMYMQRRTQAIADNEDPTLGDSRWNSVISQMLSSQAGAYVTAEENGLFTMATQQKMNFEMPSQVYTQMVNSTSAGIAELINGMDENNYEQQYIKITNQLNSSYTQMHNTAHVLVRYPDDDVPVIHQVYSNEVGKALPEAYSWADRHTQDKAKEGVNIQTAVISLSSVGADTSQKFEATFTDLRNKAQAQVEYYRRLKKLKAEKPSTAPKGVMPGEGYNVQNVFDAWDATAGTI